MLRCATPASPRWAVTAVKGYVRVAEGEKRYNLFFSFPCTFLYLFSILITVDVMNNTPKEPIMMSTTVFWTVYHAMQDLSRRQVNHGHPHYYSDCVQCACWTSLWEAANTYLRAHEAV